MGFGWNCREMHYLSNLFILHVCNFCIWTIILLIGILLKIMISSFELLFFMRHWLLIERCTQQFPGHVQNGVVYLHISISVYFPWNSTTFNFVSFLHKSAFLHRSIKGILIFQLYWVRSGQCDLYGMVWFSISSQIYPTVQLSRCCYTFVYVNDLFDHDIAIIIMRKFCLSLMCIAKRKLFK